MKFTIVREYFPDRTEGVMTCSDNDTTFRTIELPWKNNANDVSCIPEGTYKCARYRRKNGQICWQLLKVPKRTAILVHVANTVNDLLGCIGIGLKKAIFAGVVGNLIGVAVSRLAFNKFMWITRNETNVTMKVTSVTGEHK